MPSPKKRKSPPRGAKPRPKKTNARMLPRVLPKWKDPSEWVNVNHLLLQAAEDNRPALRELGVHLEIVTDPLLPEIRAIRGELLRAFGLLFAHSVASFRALGDARRFAVRVATQLHKGREVQITFEDNAGGIAVAERRLMLAPFFERGSVKKTDASRPNPLAEILEIFNRHEGSLGMDTEQGAGTQFQIRLPLTATFEMDNLKAVG